MVRFGVIARTMTHGAQDREVLGDLGLLGTQLAELHTGERSVDRAERSAILVDRVGLGIVSLHVSRPAAAPEQDDAFLVRLGRRSGGVRRLQAKGVAERETADAERAELQETSSRRALFRPMEIPTNS